CWWTCEHLKRIGSASLGGWTSPSPYRTPQVRWRPQMPMPTWDPDEEGWPKDEAGPEWEMFKSELRRSREKPAVKRTAPREEMSRCLKCGIVQKLDWRFEMRPGGKVYSNRLLVGRCPKCHYEEMLE